ncbi:alpha/beta fold hydrolase [Sphingomonas sp.]|uniref:alpha/beta fold hydrolase n=1 Tax=Sphingomonas sp. TaxID=28214 RepID=UPI001DAD6F15|nr:alpha/beta hydrolase [Sphingomonas sp.]MBX9797594.1 alpha/beta hydrolase [Sphingomonas sp.]
MTSASLYRRAIPAAARIVPWRAADGWPLRRFDWPGGGRGSMLWLGGRGEFFEKYLELFAHWHGAGWSVTAIDWRGQGGSGRTSADAHIGHIGSFGEWIADLAGFWADWSAQARGPKVIAAHSMGGHLALRGVLEAAATPDALVLSAPMLGVHSPLGATLGEHVAGLMARLGDPARAAWRENEKPGATMSRQAMLTHDPDRYQDELWWQAAQPELLLGPPSWRWVAEAFRSTRQVRTDSRLKTFATPVLMLLPMADALVDPKVSLAIAARLPDARAVSFGPESAHEILREADPVRGRALAEIDRFLAEKAPA